METFSALLAICAGNSPVPGEFPTQRPVTWNFGVFFDLRLNKQLSKQPRGWWFGTLLGSLWRQCNDEATGPPWLPHTKASDVNVTLMFSLICVWINGWINSREAGYLRRYRTHYDVSVMSKQNNISYRISKFSVRIHQWLILTFTTYSWMISVQAICTELTDLIQYQAHYEYILRTLSSFLNHRNLWQHATMLPDPIAILLWSILS